MTGENRGEIEAETGLEARLFRNVGTYGEPRLVQVSGDSVATETELRRMEQKMRREFRRLNRKPR
jgi:hypothetical protein